MFGDSDGSKDPGAAPPLFPSGDLALSSYLCDKPTLASVAAAEAEAAGEAAAGPSSPPNPVANAASDAANTKLRVERDFLHLSAPKRGDPPGDDSSVDGEKKPRLDSLLSLSVPSDGPGQSCSQPQLFSLFPSAPTADGDLRGTAAASAGGSFDGGRDGHTSRPDKILREIVSVAVSTMAHVLQDFPSEYLEVLRKAVRSMVDAPEKRDELASLQRKLERRSDLTAEALARANRTQLDILVTIKTGIATFVSGKGRVPSSELVEIFLMRQCRNLKCKSLLPVDECKICSTGKGFCSACMCMVCHEFDSAANTCSWVGCDYCSHWCHAACGLQRNLFRPGPTLKGPMGTTQMKFHCLACRHASEMFGFVKAVFSSCAEQWDAETLMKELDLVRKVFAASTSDDLEGKGLHAKAEEVLSMCGKEVISLLAATSIVLQFFKNGVKNNGGLLHTRLSAREFPFLLLESITNDFSKERIIGRGAYGVVYKGYLGEEVIAVKKLYNQPGLGDDQFNECINLMRIQHPNIVRLVGYCYETQNKVVEHDGKLVFAVVEERALCLEYLQGGSLDRHISEASCRLDWCICYGIIKGICEGLKYLHTGSKNPICHLDLKPGNILLDMDMTPKIGDFGLSRLLGSTQACVAKNSIGTLGYMPREYIDKQEITPKFDVFSLGVIIIQIMAGRTGCSQRVDMPSQEFIELVHGMWETSLQATMSSDTSRQVKTCIEIALRCVEDDPVKRPTISEIVDKLDNTHTAKSKSTLEE